MTKGFHPALSSTTRKHEAGANLGDILHESLIFGRLRAFVYHVEMANVGTTTPGYLRIILTACYRLVSLCLRQLVWQLISS